VNNAGSIIAGYGITIAAIGFYAAWIVMRGRAIGEQLGIGRSDDGSSAGEGEKGSTWT